MKALPLTIGATLVAAVTVAVGAAAGVASGASGAAVAANAADPVTGTFVLGVGFGRSPRTHTITATADGFAITTTQSYVAGGSPAVGTPFTAIDRIGVDQSDTSAANCVLAAGTVVVGQLKFTTTDAAGVRHYTGAGLKAVSAVDSPHACSTTGLGGPLYMTLSRHGDTAGKDGPANMLCWNDTSPTANSCSNAFVRLAGTLTAAGTGTGATATAPTTATRATPARPARGIVPWSSKWYRDKRFKTDHVPPVIRAIASTGTRGRPFFLLYRSKDNRGYAGETYRIYAGSTLVKAWAVMAGERDGRVQRAPATLPGTISGKLTFCVGGADLNGNRSAWSCAPLTIG